MFMQYTTLLFDLDDTLFDFEASEMRAIGLLMRNYGIEPTQEQYRLYSEINASKWKKLEKGELTRGELGVQRFADFFGCLCLNADPTQANRMYMDYLSLPGILLDGVLEVCEKLSEIYSLYLITNGTGFVQRGRLLNSPLNEYVSGVFISEDIGFNKPAKGFFDYVFAHIDEKDKSKMLVIGDSLSSDIAGARNSNLDACWVDRGSLGKGDEAKFVIKSVTELPEILKRQTKSI